MMTKATSCNPIRITKATQTGEIIVVMIIVIYNFIRNECNKEKEKKEKYSR